MCFSGSFVRQEALKLYYLCEICVCSGINKRAVHLNGGLPYTTGKVANRTNVAGLTYGCNSYSSGRFKSRQLEIRAPAAEWYTIIGSIMKLFT